jgi:hypothetical protein
MSKRDKTMNTLKVEEMPNAAVRTLRYRECCIGRHVVVADLSGIDSRKVGVIVGWNSADARAIMGQYPFNGGRTPHSLKWVAVWLNEGRLTTVPASRLYPMDRSIDTN